MRGRLDPVLWCVIIGVLFCTWSIYRQYLIVHRQLWTVAIHDRNAHFLNGLNMAQDLASGDFKHLHHELAQARIWGPLHSVLLAPLLHAFGCDDTSGVLVSLIAWAGTIVVAFLLARRLSPRATNSAGLVAALLVASSPAMRAFATDVMLESLGAFLTLAILYQVAVVMQDGGTRAWRLLGLELTLLFFHKYNYWFLVMLALAGTIIWETGWRWHLRWVLPVLLVAGAASVGIVTLAGGGPELRAALDRHALRTPVDLLCWSYRVLALVVLIPLRRIPWTNLAPPYRILILWHGVPVLMSFLFSQRLAYFLIFMNPATNAGVHPATGVLSGALYYLNCLMTEYHVSSGLALGTLVLVCCALLRSGARPGTVPVVCLALVATVLTIAHLNRQARFMHSWVATVWVLAGIGAARLPARLPHGIAGVLAAVLVPTFWCPAHVSEGGPRPGAPTTLDVSDAYLPELAHIQHAGFAANVPIKFFAAWTYQARYPSRPRPVTFDFCYWNQKELEDFRRWLGTRIVDRLVVIDALPGSPLAQTPNPAPPGQVAALMEGQRAFIRCGQFHIPDVAARVTIWSRGP